PGARRHDRRARAASALRPSGPRRGSAATHAGTDGARPPPPAPPPPAGAPRATRTARSGTPRPHRCGRTRARRGGLLQTPATRQTGGSCGGPRVTTRPPDMDFAFTDAELAFAAEARAWLGANLPPAWRRDHCWTRADDAAWLDVARDWQRMLFEGGWAAIAWPRAHGGRGATVIERWLFDQELDAVGAPRPAAASSVDLIGPAILHHGTAAQRDRFLRPLLSGSELWCQGFSEPGAGSDLASLRTRAERRGGTFVVNGQKVWTSHADIADWCFLLCRTEPDQPKHKGISLLLVDMRAAGITVRPLRQMTGEAEFCEVFFDNVRVPADLMVGAPGAGWQIAMDILGVYGTICDEGHLPEAEQVAREYLYSRAETIMGGTSEIQRNLIAQRILGLPR